MKITAPTKLRYRITNKLLPFMDSVFTTISDCRPDSIVVMEQDVGISGAFIPSNNAIYISNNVHVPFDYVFFHEYIHFIQHLANQRFDYSVDYHSRKHEIQAKKYSKILLEKFKGEVISG
jgi:hypothetical protein